MQLLAIIFLACSIIGIIAPYSGSFRRPVWRITAYIGFFFLASNVLQESAGMQPITGIGLVLAFLAFLACSISGIIQLHSGSFRRQAWNITAYVVMFFLLSPLFALLVTLFLTLILYVAYDFALIDYFNSITLGSLLWLFIAPTFGFYFGSDLAVLVTRKLLAGTATGDPATDGVLLPRRGIHSHLKRLSFDLMILGLLLLLFLFVSADAQSPGLVLLDCWVSLMVLVELISWVLTINAYGHLPLKVVRQTLHTALKTKYVVLLTAGLGLLGVAIAGALFRGELPPIPFLILVGLGVFGIAHTCLPPSLLLLGASKPEKGRLYTDIMWAIGPLKLIHLLNDFGFDVFTRDMLHQVSYRTDSSWIDIVDQVMNTVPAIVIDTRSRSNPILEEARMVLSSHNLREKTLFIVEPTGESPVLEEIRQEEMLWGRFAFSTSSNMEMPYRILYNNVEQEGVKPSPDRSFKLFGYGGPNVPLDKIWYGIDKDGALFPIHTVTPNQVASAVRDATGRLLQGRVPTLSLKSGKDPHTTT